MLSGIRLLLRFLHLSWLPRILHALKHQTKNLSDTSFIAAFLSVIAGFCVVFFLVRTLLSRHVTLKDNLE